MDGQEHLRAAVRKEVSYERQEIGRPPYWDNRKARHIYEYLETIEAGISLTGPEVKSFVPAGELYGQLCGVQARRSVADRPAHCPVYECRYVEQNADRPRKTADARTGNRVVCRESGTEGPDRGSVEAVSQVREDQGGVGSWTGPQAARSPRGTEAPCRDPGYAARIARITAPSGSMTGRRLSERVRQPCSLWDVHGIEGYTMEAAFGKAPLISRKGKNTDALGRFA